MAFKKWCWVAKETKKGWRLSLEIGKDTMRTSPQIIFKTVKAVEVYANSFIPSDGKIAFIHLKNTKFPIR